MDCGPSSQRRLRTSADQVRVWDASPVLPAVLREAPPRRPAHGTPPARRRLPWLLAVPLIVGGSVSAHALGKVLFAAGASEHGADEVARVSGGYAAQLPIVVGILASLALIWIAARLLRANRSVRSGIAPLWFLLLPPQSFALQEFAERMLHAESAPFSAIHEPAFIAALVLQLPFGLLAYVVARLLLAVAEEVSRLLAGPEEFPAARPSVFGLLLPPSAAGARTPVLASGHSQRGPPAPDLSF